MVRSATSDRFVAGARIGDYRVEYEIEIDAIAVSYLATHVVLPRQARIKVPHPGSRAAAVQLLREACIMESLSHAGIPRVHECGVLADRRPWSAMEVMPGATLKQLAADGSLALFDLAVVLRDVADILRHAHERGVAHRRLVTSSIVRTQRHRRGYAITDWSDARTLGASADEVVDPKDDVYALGLIAFRALTGRPAEPSVSAATHCPVAPPELTALIDDLLVEPVMRPAASEVFERALWLCDTLAVSPMLEKPRWTPPQGYVAERVSAGSVDDDRGGFAVQTNRVRTS